MLLLRCYVRLHCRNASHSFVVTLLLSAHVFVINSRFHDINLDYYHLKKCTGFPEKLWYIYYHIFVYFWLIVLIYNKHRKLCLLASSSSIFLWFFQAVGLIRFVKLKGYDVGWIYAISFFWKFIYCVNF